MRACLSLRRSPLTLAWKCNRSQGLVLHFRLNIDGEAVRVQGQPELSFPSLPALVRRCRAADVLTPGLRLSEALLVHSSDAAAGAAGMNQRLS